MLRGLFCVVCDWLLPADKCNQLVRVVCKPKWNFCLDFNKLEWLGFSDSVSGQDLYIFGFSVGQAIPICIHQWRGRTVSTQWVCPKIVTYSVQPWSAISKRYAQPSHGHACIGHLLDVPHAFFSGGTLQTVHLIFFFFVLCKLAEPENLNK